MPSITIWSEFNFNRSVTSTRPMYSIIFDSVYRIKVFATKSIKPRANKNEIEGIERTSRLLQQV